MPSVSGLVVFLQETRVKLHISRWSELQFYIHNINSYVTSLFLLYHCSALNGHFVSKVKEIVWGIIQLIWKDIKYCWLQSVVPASHTSYCFRHSDAIIIAHVPNLLKTKKGKRQTKKYALERKHLAWQLISTQQLIGDETVKTFPLISGVPQGSILVALLFVW